MTLTAGNITTGRFSSRVRLRTAIVAGSLAAAVIGGVVAVGAQADSGPTVGPLPIDRLDEQGQISPALVPDFLRLRNNKGEIYGYAKREDMLPLLYGRQPSNDPYAVYDKTLKTVIGHYHPGIGFVPLGKSVNSPDIDRQAPPSSRAG
jgi:hypothetical protein